MIENSTAKRCPYVEKCGGCMMDGTHYDVYLKAKEDKLNEILKEDAKTLFDERIHLVGMQNPYYYRYKCNAAFGWKKDGTVLSGSYMERTHKICDRDVCLIENQMADSIIYDIKKLIPSFKIRIYNEDNGYGYLRHVMVRISRSTGEAMVILVAVDSIFPSKNNFVKALRERHPEISTVILNVNDKTTNMVLGDRNVTIYGKGYIMDTLAGVTFRISPGDFFQVNPVMTEKIYQTAIELGKLKKTDVILDAYCGIGTIGLAAAGKVKKVIGVELNSEAVRDAKISAKENKITNASLYAGDAGEFINEMRDEEKLDVVYLDPPRSGTTDEFIEALGKRKPSRIVYVSCSPETLARDLSKIKKNGYAVKQIRAFDQFPFTDGHVETVVSLYLK